MSVLSLVESVVSVFLKKLFDVGVLSLFEIVLLIFGLYLNVSWFGVFLVDGGLYVGLNVVIDVVVKLIDVFCGM